MNAFIQFLLKLFQGLLKGNNQGRSEQSLPKPAAKPKPVAKAKPVAPPKPARPAEPAPIPTSFDTTPTAPQPIVAEAAEMGPLDVAHGLEKEEVFKEVSGAKKLKAVKVTDGKKEGAFPRFTSSRNSWEGWYTRGDREIKDFVKAERALLLELNMTDSAQNLLQAVSDNEGKLEAINAYDGAFLSFGIFQWTLGTRDNAGELPALLKKIKNTYPDTFQQYFGRYGVDVSDDTNGITGFLSLNGELINKRALKEQFRSAEWVYRFWRAGNDPKVQAVEVDHGMSRLKTFYWRYKVHGFPLNEIITSEYGVALILDNHVNLPALVRKALEAAMNETGLKDPTNWGTAEENKVIESYIKHRATKVGRFGPMYDAIKRAKNTAKYLDTNVISAERGSFVAAHSSTRSIDMGNYVPEPEDYNPADYPEVDLETEGRDMEFTARGMDPDEEI